MKKAGMFNSDMNSINQFFAKVEFLMYYLNEKLSYKDKSLYHDGVKLTVSSEYMIPSLESGIVVYIGEKENYKQVVIVQQMNGVDVWYGNIKQANVKLYDYVEKGSLIGQVDNKTLYLVFQKEGKFVDYQSYLAKS